MAQHGTFTAFREALANLIRAKTASDDEALAVGRIIEQHAPRGISDGLTYDLPVLWPDYMRQADEQTQRAYLREATDRSFFHFQFDSPNKDASDLAVNMATEDPLKEWNSATRKMVLSNTHAANDRNPLAKAAQVFTKYFVVGDGLQLTARNTEVKRILDEFIENDEDTPVREYESAFVEGLMLDGELVVQFIEQRGKVVMIPHRPWELTDIETGQHRRDYVSFKFNFESEGEVTLPADEVLFDAINRKAYETRGKPDTYVILPWLRAHKEWLEDRARTNYWRNALLYFVQVDSTSSATIAAVASRWAIPPTPGSIAVESAKVNAEVLSPNIGAPDVAEDGRQMKLQIAVGLQLPEYFLSDGENANLASATRQELPAMARFQWWQNHMIRNVWRPVFTRVLNVAAKRGLLEGMNLDEQGRYVVEEQNGKGEAIAGAEPLLLRDAFAIAYEPLSQADLLPQTQALQIQAQNGWIDDETATNELGYDFEEIQDGITRDNERQRDRMASGEIPTPPIMPGMTGNEPDNDEQVDEETGQDGNG